MSSPPQSPMSGDTVIIESDDVDQAIGDFAHLIPFNPRAEAAFHAVAQKMLDDDTWRPHARSFMVIESREREHSPELNPVTGEHEPTKPQKLLSGYYRINFDTLPLNPIEGWHIGSEAPERRGEEVNEIILTLSGNEDHVRWRHARLAFNFSSYTFLIIAEKRRTVYLNGVEAVENSQRSLGKREAALAIGNLNYKLVFTGLDKIQARRRLDQLRSIFRLSGTVPPLSIDPTPALSVYEYMGFVIGEVFAQGSTCTVSKAVHKETGNLVVAKRMKRTRNNKATIEHEVRVLRHLASGGQHSRLCNLVDEAYNGGTHNILGPNNVDEVLLFYSPVADETFYDLIRFAPSFDNKLIFFKQFLEGIAFIHKAGVMHRDIKPLNMAIVSRSPPNGVIIDLGMASFGKTSTTHTAGTIPYLAPEIWRLKDEDPHSGYRPRDYISPPYSNSVDLWAYGLSAYQLFCEKPCWWQAKRHDMILYQIRADLRSMCIKAGLCEPDVPHDHIPEGSVAELIWQMLEVDSAKRISAKQALRHECLDETMTSTQIGDGQLAFGDFLNAPTPYQFGRGNSAGTLGSEMRISA